MTESASSNPADLPLISLITVVRNAAATIEKALQSVAAQTYPHVEYIVLDADSTDGTQQIIEKYKDHIALYQSRPDKGPTYAFNEAVSLAKGELLGLLSADDWLEPHAMEHIATLYQKNPEAELVTFGLQEYDTVDGAIVARRRYRDRNSEDFLLEDGLYCQGLNRFYHKSVFRHLGEFDADRWSKLADREFYIRCGLRKLKRAYSGDVLYHFVVHDGSTTASTQLPTKLRLLRETIDIANHHLSAFEANRDEKKLLQRWYCFNALRLAWFEKKSGEYVAAFKTLLTAFLRYPIAFFATLKNPRMPQEYRPEMLS